MENNNLLKIFRQKFLRNAKHAISARGSSVDQQNALAPIRRVGSCKEGDMEDDAYVIALSIVHTCLVNAMGGGELTYESCLQEISPGVDEKVPTVMNYAPGQGKPARPFFNDPGNEVLAFPALFPLGSGNFSDTRDVRLTWKDYAEARLYNSDRRWAKNPEYIFWLQHNVEAEQVRSSISTFMRKGLKSSSKGQFVNAGLLKKHFQGDEDVISKIPTYKFMENIRGSPAYWRKVRSEWIATVDQQGMHTFFLTFSFNDLMYSIPAIVKLNNPGGFQNDADLLQYCQDLTWVRKHEILKDDPIIAVRMYSRYILNVIGKLLKKGMLGPYESHLGRNEFAQRGSPHSHLMVKTKDAPTQADNNGLSEGPYTAFLDQFISTKYISAEEDPSFNQLLKVQSHSHTSTCTRPGKECRFNYPKPVSATTQILPNNDDERVQTRRFKVVYKRDPGDEMINTYNPGLLKAVRSNMDIQAIVGYFDVIYYIISYATKNEKAQTKALRELGKNLGNLENTKSREVLRELGNCYQMTRDVSIQESVNRTLSHLPMKFSDPGTIWVDVNPPEKQHGMLKAQSVLEGMPDKDTDVWVPGLCQKYSARPDSMLDVCYADFAAYYISYSGPPPKSDVMDCVEDDDTETPAAGRPSLPVITLKNKLGRMKKRGKQIVIRYYTPPIKSKPEEYYHSKICLFYPWVDHADIKGKFNTYKESFVDKESIIKPNWKRYQHLEDDDFQKLLDDCNTLFEDFMEEEQAKPALSKEFLHTHPVAGMKDPDDQKNFEFEYADPPITDTEYNRIVSSLNEKQRDIFDQIDDHSTRESQGLKNTQLIHFISGAGGCGKSFLIKALRHCINRKFSDGLRCIVTALTGSASVTVDGMTIHTACALDTQHGFMWISDFKRIPAQKLANMKKAIFNKVLYLIIDEVSMMGASLLALLNARLNELKSIEARDGTVYGGINVIFCGDFYQLPPVSAGVVYDPKANFGDHNLGPHLWKDYVTFTELTEVIRSKGDAAFTALCHRVRTGAQTEEDKETLRSRVVGYQPVRDMMDSMLICYTTKEVNEHNKLCIDYMKLTTVVHTITAIDSFKSPELNCTVSLQKLISDNPSQTAGLPSTLEITEGANVMIRVNVTTLDRIVNGVTGVVRYIDFKAPSAIPHVYVEFHDKLAGTKTGLKHETCSIFCQKPCPKLGFVKIVPVEKEFKSPVNKRTYVRRFQLPMVLCWASTVHKVQGLTLTDGHVHLAKPKPQASWQNGMAYTALSRFTKLTDVKLRAFDPEQIKTCSSVKDEYKRLRALPKYVNLYSNSKRNLAEPSPSDQPAKQPRCVEDDVEFIPFSSLSIDSPPPSQPDSPHIECFPCPSPPLKKFKQSECDAEVPGPSNIPGPANVSPSRGPAIPLDHFIGRARVIDYWCHPSSQELANTLFAHGFEVKTEFVQLQKGSSCGFNAAMISAKLAHYENVWFDVDVKDCCWGSAENKKSPVKSDMILMANLMLRDLALRERHLETYQEILNNPAGDRFLTDTEVNETFGLYNEVCFANSPCDRTRIMPWPFSKDGYVNQILKPIILGRKGCYSKLQVSIVNTHNDTGLHWYVVAFEMYPDFRVSQQLTQEISSSLQNMDNNEH